MPEPLSHRVKERSPNRRMAVTVCVAAMCEENTLLGASDRMLTAGDVEFEPTTTKIYSITNSNVVMIAGESSLQIEILQRLYAFVAQRLKDMPNEWVPTGDIAIEYHRIYQNIKSTRAERRILNPLGLTVDTFVKRQNELSPHIAKDLTSEILNFEMPAIEAIVTGVDGNGAHIYLVGNSEVNCRDAIGFAAIGAGYWHANSQFMFAGHTRNKPLPETLLLTYAAKKRAEVAPGVGQATDMFTMGPRPGSYVAIHPEVIEDVDKIYRRTRTRATRSVKTANQEVNKYVEQLGKAAAAQEQKTAAPNPTEKPNGKDTSGEESSGTGKPN
jgi:hypothetical protein